MENNILLNKSYIKNNLTNDDILLRKLYNTGEDYKLLEKHNRKYSRVCTYGT